jgi:hypothetical protein
MAFELDHYALRGNGRDSLVHTRLVAIAIDTDDIDAREKLAKLRLIRGIYTLEYFRDPRLQRDVHRSQNRIEAYHELRSVIA